MKDADAAKIERQIDSLTERVSRSISNQEELKNMIGGVSSTLLNITYEMSKEQPKDTAPNENKDILADISRTLEDIHAAIVTQRTALDKIVEQLERNNQSLGYVGVDTYVEDLSV